MNKWPVCPSSRGLRLPLPGLLERKPYPGCLSVRLSSFSAQLVGQASWELSGDAGVQSFRTLEERGGSSSGIILVSVKTTYLPICFCFSKKHLVHYGKFGKHRKVQRDVKEETPIILPSRENHC